LLAEPFYFIGEEIRERFWKVQLRRMRQEWHPQTTGTGLLLFQMPILHREEAQAFR
jgi:hypothetical protein